MTPEDLKDYQWRGVQHILDHPNAMVWLDVGMGKTILVETAFLELQDRLESLAMLVISTKRIIQQVWRQEARKWSHTRGLRFSLIDGTAAQRTVALKQRADVYLVSYDNLAWLAGQLAHLWLKKGQYPPFDTLVYDEVTRLKNPSSKRVKALAPLLPYFSRRIGLTGEPAANGYADLFGQYLCVDLGHRLGKQVGQFRDRFLKPMGYGGFAWGATETGKREIHDRIADITLELEDHERLTLPPLRNNTVLVDLPPDVRAKYDRLEAEFFLELDSGAVVEIACQAVLGNKLLQIASGAVYTESGGWDLLHDQKIEALRELVEESGGRPMLLGYTYLHEAERIKKAFPGAVFLSSKLPESEINRILRAWERDEIPLLCGHPASMGHGLNLHGSSARAAVWFSLPWSLELYHQFNGRLFGGHRRQGDSVLHHIVARDTMDEVVRDVLGSKKGTQDALKTAIRNYRERR